MHLVVPASGIYGAMINRENDTSGMLALYITKLYLSSFSLTIGMENLGLQNIQRPNTVNVSMQVTSIEPYAKNSGVQPWDGMNITPWARSIITSRTGLDKRIDYNELYVVLKPNQGHYYPSYRESDAREKYQIIKVTDITFDIPEYSAVSRGESPTLNTFTLNGIADAREPVIIGLATESGAQNVLSGLTTSGTGVWNAPIYPRGSNDVYAVLQTGEIINP